MKVTGIFKKRNAEFDQAHADEFHKGEESGDNVRFEWEDEIDVTEDVEDFKVKNHAMYSLTGEYGDGKQFHFDIPDMTICESLTESGEMVQFAVSGKLIQKTERKDNKETGLVRFIYLIKATTQFYNPIPGVFIRPEDFPEELKSMEELDD